MSQTENPPPVPGAGTSAAEQVKEKASEVAGQAEEKAHEAAERTKGQLRSTVDQRSSQAGERVTTAAGDVRSVGEQLRAQGKDGAAKLADQTAERAEKLGGYLKGSDADRILADVEDVARRQPWAVVAGGLVLGFAASRFLKASSRERYRMSAAAEPTGRRQIPTEAGGI
jgi:hypothetical protein